MGDGPSKITKKTLIDWGFKPGPGFKEMLAKAQDMESAGRHPDAILVTLWDTADAIENDSHA